MLSRTEHRGVCRLLSSVMSGTEGHTDREDDYRFLHSMLMEKKLHLLFKIHERLKRFEKRSPIPVQEQAASLASDFLEDLNYQSWRDEVKELVQLFSQPHFKSLLSVHDAVAQRDFEATLAPIANYVLDEDDHDSVRIVSLVKTKDPLTDYLDQNDHDSVRIVSLVKTKDPLTDYLDEDEDDSVRIVSLVKTKDPLTDYLEQDDHDSVRIVSLVKTKDPLTDYLDQNNYDSVRIVSLVKTKDPLTDYLDQNDHDSVRIVSLVKTKDPLGATIKQDKVTGAIVVARIIRGGAADRSGLIHEGDELKEVNGVSLEHRKPEEILPLLARSRGQITFKIVPASSEDGTSSNKKVLRGTEDDPNFHVGDGRSLS